MPGYLRPHVQTVFPGSSDPKFRKEQNPTGDRGSYWVEFTFQVNPRLSSEESPKALRQDFIGDSLLIIGKPLASGETRKHVFTIRTGPNSSMEYFVYCNKSGFLSHINIRYTAGSFDEAISCAQDNIKPFFSVWSARFNVPIIVFRIRALEEATNVVRNIVFHQFYTKKDIDATDLNRTYWCPADVRAIAFYHDALNATSPKYQFLCYFKVVELVLGLRAKLALKKEPSRRRKKEVLPDEEWFKLHLDSELQARLIGKKFTAIRDDVLRPIRNRIAHGLLDEKNACRPEDQIADNEIYRFLPVLKLIAERLLLAAMPEQ
jgi:hypothetical protein